MLEFINDNIVSVITTLMLLTAGAYFSVKLRVFYFRHPIRVLRLMLKKEKKDGISPFRAVTLALAGTLGVGNVAGVASAIAIGGYGAVFWMWASAFIAMSLKYAEIVLAVMYRKTDRVSGEYYGGAPYYIIGHLKKCGHSVVGRLLAAAFALFCIINSITMGCLVQSNAVATSFAGVADANPAVIGVTLAVLCGAVVVGNVRWISAVSEKIVPAMTLGYVFISVAVIAVRWTDVPRAFEAIFADAFKLEGAAGGAVGFFVSHGMRAGTVKGLMSNEAGCGTAPTAHAAASTGSPAKQGLWGIFEVFVDTVLLCTLTAIVIVLAGGEALELSADPMMMAIRSYSSVLGKWSEYYICVSVLLFAFATMICWAHYGKESVRCLTDRKAPQMIYVLLFCVFIAVGAISAPSLAWLAADMAIGIMTVINLPVLLSASSDVRRETEKLFEL